MTCGSCKYEWCWICGLGVGYKSRLCPLMDLLHIFCEFYLEMTKSRYEYCFKLLGLILIIIAPAIAVIVYCLCFVAGALASIGFSIYCAIFIFDKFFRKIKYENTKFKIAMAIPFLCAYLSALGLVLCLGYACATLAAAIILVLGCLALVLGYISLVFILTRLFIHWVCCKRTVKHK